MDRDAGTETAQDMPSLTAIVADLQMHLRDDTYRFDRARGSDGRNAFAVALWRLDRLKRARGLPEEQWENVDLVIEFARARSLERLRRYDSAAETYARVVARASLLEASAQKSLDVVRRFAASSGPPDIPLDTPAEELAWIERRIEGWRDLAWEQRHSIHGPLAQEEQEAWEMLRVEWFSRHGGSEEALRACERLIERNPHSKLYPKHLIRLGDLYAQGARELFTRFRANAAPFDAPRYEQMLDRAFSAYELASQHPGPALQQEARGRIGALLSYHRTVTTDAP